jgi:hypothetical protein
VACFGKGQNFKYVISERVYKWFDVVSSADADEWKDFLKRLPPKNREWNENVLKGLYFSVQSNHLCSSRNNTQRLSTKPMGKENRPKQCT